MTIFHVFMLICEKLDFESDDTIDAPQRCKFNTNRNTGQLQC